MSITKLYGDFKSMKITFIILLTLIFLSCNSEKKQDDFNQALTLGIENPQYYAPYCIYLMKENDSLSTRKVEQLVSNLLPTYKLVDSLSSEIGVNGYTVVHFANPKEDYPAPNVDYLQHSGHNLTEEEINGLQNPSKAVLINFSGTKENVRTDHIQINAIIDSLVNLQSAIVTDYITYESFNKTSWRSDRVLTFTKNNQDIMSQYTIHLYREDKFCRAVTLGMGKFCLPDISIEGISCNNQNSYASLINLLGQTWLEQPNITKDSMMIVDISKIKNDSVRSRLNNTLEENAEKKGILHLKGVTPQEGDDFNTQLQIVFNDQEFSSPQEEQQALISTIFGATDAIEYINHDKDLLAASHRAKQELPKFKKLFNEGLQPGYSILLKAPFETDSGGNEWMWVEVTEWSDSKITGILQNDPFEISDLKSGAIVSCNQDEIFDYIYYHPDGTEEGNETGKIIARNQQQ